MARNLPIGIQSFERMRGDGYVYVDKTAYVYVLARSSRPYFLSRPRRFGKSLLVSTLHAYFEGKRKLFSGLAIEALEEQAAAEEGREPWQAHPVFYLSFNAGDYAREGGWSRFWTRHFETGKIGGQSTEAMEALASASSGC